MYYIMYFSYRWWLKIQDMQNINVKLPPGLTSNMVSEILKNCYKCKIPNYNILQIIITRFS